MKNCNLCLRVALGLPLSLVSGYFLGMHGLTVEQPDWWAIVVPFVILGALP